METMRPRVRSALAFFVAFMSLSGSLHAASIIEEKLNLERSIQDRCERLVEKIIGSRDMVVLVNVELETEQGKKSEGSPASYSGMRVAEEEYLPGVTYSYLPVDSAAITPKGAVIKRINILVTLDTGVSAEFENRITKDLHTLLGLNPLRGDNVSVQKIVFAKPPTTWQSVVMHWSSGIYWLFTLLTISLLLFLPLKNFFKVAVRALDTRINEARTRAQEAAVAGPLPAIPAETEKKRLASASSGKESGKRFGFINEDNVKNLAFLMKKEAPEKIAVIINYISAVYASQVLSSLGPQLQAQVALNLSHAKLLEPADVDTIEREIKGKIDYLLGGEEYFLNLLDQADRRTQENIINTLEKDDALLADKLKKSLFFFEDIVLLDKSALQRVIRAAQGRNLSLALALKTAPETVRNKLMEALTEGARAILTEQINLLGEVSERRIAEEQRQIANLVREMEKAGIIVIDRSRRTDETTPA